MAKHGAQIRDDTKYEALREKGMSKNKAARIASAPAKGKSAPKTSTRQGGRSGSYEHWSKDELLSKARQVGIGGRSKMNKTQLAKALREH